MITKNWMMIWLTIGLAICLQLSDVQSTVAPTGQILFPLTDITNSIHSEYSMSLNKSFSSKFHQFYKNDGYVLDLPRLSTVPNPYPGFIASKEVVAVNLQSNNIHRISPGSFDSIPNIRILDLSYNNLGFCDFFTYGSCVSNLETLIIEENQLPGDNLNREISKAGCFPRLQNLYIRKNHIRKLSFSLRKAFPNLVSLYLSDNEIDIANFLCDVPATLTNLYVERNHIFSVSSSITQNLRTLVADKNIIGSICYKNCGDTSLKLLGTTRLEVLSLACNKITHIEACAFRDSFGLVSLDLSGNEIETINSATFVPLRALTQLTLDNNYLSCVPNLNGNWNLKTLSLRNNKLVEIRRDHFSTATTLQRLFLSGNRIRTIECDTFSDLTWLQELDLSSNQLEVLPSGWMSGLSNLQHLNLRNNRFSYVNQLSLSYSLSLQTLYLEKNTISHTDVLEIKKYCPSAQIYVNECEVSCQSRDYRKEVVYDHVSRASDVGTVFWETKTKFKSEFSYNHSSLTVNHIL